MSFQLARRIRWTLLLIVALGLILTMTTLHASAAPFSESFVQATPVPSPQPTATSGSTQYSFLSVFIVSLLIVLLGVLFGFLFVWSNKLDQASYLGTLYRDTIQDIEYKRLKSDLMEKFEKHEFHREVEQDSEWLQGHPIPKMSAELAHHFETQGSSFLSRTGKPDESPVDARLYALGYLGESLKAKRKDIDDFKQQAEQWNSQVDIKAKQRYREELNKAHTHAQKRARQAINVDLSVLRGRGAEFVLEFTTVVVIIFSAVILGVLGILETQQIGTLLAAIAGYVLGRATTRTRSSASESESASVKTRMDETTIQPDKSAE